MFTILPHMVWPSCEFRNAGAARGSLKIHDAKIMQKSPSAHHLTFVGLYLRNVPTIGKKVTSQCGELRLTNG